MHACEYFAWRLYIDRVCSIHAYNACMSLNDLHFSNSVMLLSFNTHTHQHACMHVQVVRSCISSIQDYNIFETVYTQMRDANITYTNMTLHTYIHPCRSAFTHQSHIPFMRFTEGHFTSHIHAQVQVHTCTHVYHTYRSRHQPPSQRQKKTIKKRRSY
jgi:hypothetical protein